MQQHGLLALLLIAAAGCSDSQSSQSLQSSASEIVSPAPGGQGQSTQHRLLAAEAEKIEDRVARCRAYPDLPGNAWPKGSSAAICALLIEPELPLDEILQLLSHQEGAARLDRHFAKLRSEPPVDGALFRAYSVFDQSDDAKEAAGKWLDASPGSAFAKVAMANVYVDAGFDARGSEFIHKTPASRIATMDRWFERAMPLYEQALRTEPHLGPACTGLMAIARQRGDGALLARATATCDGAEGHSWYVFNARRIAAQAKWGGNEAMRRALSGDARSRMVANPALAMFLANADAELPYALASDGRWQEAAPGLEQASVVSPNALWLGYAGVAAHKLGQEHKAVVFLSQALRFAPDSIWFREMRATARTKTGDDEGAMSDLQRIMSTGKASGHAHSVMGKLLMKAGRVPEAKSAFQQAMQHPNQRLWAFRKWCEVIITSEHDVPASLACSEGLVNEYPEDTEALFMRAWVLTENRQPGADVMAERFLAQANVTNRRESQMILQLQRLRGR